MASLSQSIHLILPTAPLTLIIVFRQDNLEESKFHSSLSALRAPTYLLRPQREVWTMAAAAGAVLTHDPGPIGAVTGPTATTQHMEEKQTNNF